MRRGKKSGWGRAVGFGGPWGNGRAALLAALLACLAGTPLRGQEPLPPGPPARPDAAPAPAPAFPAPHGTPPAAVAGSAARVFAPDADCGACDYVPVPQCEGNYPCGFYLRTGVVRPLGDGFIEERLRTGWMIQGGLRGPLGFPRPNAVFFKELGLGYWTNEGDGNPVAIAGRLGGPNVPEDQTRRFRELFLIDLLRLHRVDVHAAVGGSYRPGFLNRRDSRLFHLDFRAGIRGGAIEVDSRRTVPPDVRAAIRTILNDDNGPIEFSTQGINDPRLFFGIFGAFGVSVTYPDARLFGRSLGSVTLGLEAELSHDWFSLGDYDRSDDGFSAVTPMASILFSF